MSYECNSPIALLISDFDRLISVYRLAQVVLYRDTALLGPPYIEISPYSDRLISGHRLTRTALLGHRHCLEQARNPSGSGKRAEKKLGQANRQETFGQPGTKTTSHAIKQPKQKYRHKINKANKRTNKQATKYPGNNKPKFDY